MAAENDNPALPDQAPPPSPLDHHALLFVSELAPGAPADAVVTITRQARHNNGRNGITGLLVFDGAHFAQLMEGPAEAVVKTAELMRTDSRHAAMEILNSASTSKPTRFPTWRLGYLVLDLQMYGIASLRGQRGAAAMESFNFMLPALDMALGEALPANLPRRRR